MNKKERVIAAIHGHGVDAVPSSFSLHFPTEEAAGDAAVKAHLRFFKETDTDILKVMNENLVPYVGEFETAAQYARALPRFKADAAFIVRQIDMTKRILDACEPTAFTVGTMHGVMISSAHPMLNMRGGMSYEERRQFQLQLFHQDPTAMLDVCRRIANALCMLAEQYIHAGLDGIYYAALGGETCYFSDEEYDRWIKPLERQVLECIQQNGGYVFLHICKKGLNMKRFVSYSDCADVINWGIYEAPMSLEAGTELFKGKTVLGGLKTHDGILDHGSDEEIRSRVKEIIAAHGPRRFILGADCTLPTNLDTHRIRTAVEAARSFV